MRKIKIEKGVELPEKRYKYERQYPLKEMRNWDSVLISEKDVTHIDNFLRYYKIRYNLRLVVRRVGGGWRVWRVPKERQQIKIDKGIKIPTTYGNGTQGVPKYPFKKMEIGDSIFLPKMSSIYAQAIVQYYRRRYKYSFKTSREKDGVRVWRVENVKCGRFGLPIKKYKTN